jgi:hypothetical protein
MRFRTFILPWAIAITVICAVESAMYAIYRPNIIERSDFLVMPIQRYLAMLPERWIIWDKMRKLPEQTPTAIQAGDSSGFYGIMPDVVSEYIRGQRLLDLSCCANQGFRGYLVLLELALQKYRSLRYAIVYVTPTVSLNESQWNRSAPDVIFRPGQTIPMLGDAMYSNFVSYRKYLYPPSNALRPSIYSKIMLGKYAPKTPPTEREPNPVFERADVMHVRNGYMIEHDLQSDIPAGCVPMSAARDPSTGSTYWELFAEEFVALAKKYDVTPVVIFAPTAFTACDQNQDFRDEIVRLRVKFPSLRIPYDPYETWPNNFFSVPAHVQRTFAIEASRRLGRALRALEDGKDLAENLAAEGPLKEEPKMHVVGATLTEECGWSPDFKTGYFGDVSAVIREACEGKTACAYNKGSDTRDLLPSKAECKAVYIVDYQCEGEPVRSFREEGRAFFEGTLRIDCRHLSYLARDPMPYGIQIAYATFGANDGGVVGNATTPIAARCQGLLSCEFPIDVEKLGGQLNDVPKDLEIVYRCDRELATRVLTLPATREGATVRFACTLQSASRRGLISVANATYGGKCGGPSGNASHIIATLCEGKARCDLPLLGSTLAAAAPACARELHVDYRCEPKDAPKTAERTSDAPGSTQLDCPTN